MGGFSRFCSIDADRLLLPFVYLKMKNVGPGIMADDIQIVLAAYDLCAIQLGEEDCFAIKIGAGQKIAERIHNATAAAR